MSDQWDDLPRRVDVAVIGGGLVGCASAAILADRGAHVLLVERTAIGAGASGRNLGALQHPFDPVLAPLYQESLSRYRALAERSGSFRIGSAPAGLLLVGRDADAVEARAVTIRATSPELDPQVIPARQLQRLEPSLARGLTALRLETGYPIPPASATRAWATLAEEAGVDFVVGTGARPAVEGGAATGIVLDDGRAVEAQAVLVAAGPWTPALADPSGTWTPIRPTYGVTLQLRLGAAAPAAIVEEDELDQLDLSRADAAAERALGGPVDGEPPSLFSLATADGVSTLGSTFLPSEPDAGAIESLLIRRAAAFMPAIATAEVIGRRMCARPQSVDGRPFIGPLAGTEGLFVCAGHGPWGISIGPATAAMAARAILDRTAAPPELAAARLV